NAVIAPPPAGHPRRAALGCAPLHETLDGRRCYIVTLVEKSTCDASHAHAPSPPASSAPSRPRTSSGRGFAVAPAYLGRAAAGDCRRAHCVAVGGCRLGDE